MCLVSITSISSHSLLERGVCGILGLLGLERRRLHSRFPSSDPVGQVLKPQNITFYYHELYERQDCQRKKKQFVANTEGQTALRSTTQGIPSTLRTKVQINKNQNSGLTEVGVDQTLLIFG